VSGTKIYRVGLVVAFSSQDDGTGRIIDKEEFAGCTAGAPDLDNFFLFADCFDKLPD
jgi:hypothetical protein